MKKKNVLFLTATPIWSLNNKVGAPSCYNTIQGYADRGWNTCLITTNQIDDELFHNVKVVSVALQKTIIAVDRAKNKAKNKVMKFYCNVRFSLAVKNAFIQSGEELLKTLDSKNTIIYAYEVHAVAAGKYLSNKYNTPLVTRFQGTIMYNKNNTLINQIAYYPHYQALKESADLIIMTNDGTCGDIYLKSIGNNSKMLFLRNGVDISFSSESIVPQSEMRKILGLNGDEIILMTLSRIVKWKRVDRAILALNEVIKTRNDCRLVVVGAGDAMDDLVKLVDNLNLQEFVIFAGAVPQKEVVNYLQIADIFLSLYDLGNAGNPTFEAMKCGKPIIALNNGNTKELLTNGDTAILVEPEKEEDIPRQILLLLKDEERRKFLGRNAQNYANMNFYSWKTRIDKECEEVIKLLE